MKLKLTLMAAVATLALGYQAHATIASVGVTTNYDKLNLSMTVRYQTIDDSNSAPNTYIYKSATKHFGNKELLAYMQTWTNNLSFPAGSFLAFDWNSDEVVVLAPDKTNVLFYAGDGVANGVVTASVSLDFFYDGGFSVVEKYVNPSTGKGSDVYTYDSTAHFQLQFSDGVSADYINLQGYGANVETWNEHWTETASVTTDDVWTDTEHLNINGGWGYLNDNSAAFTATGSAAGHSPLK